MTDWPDSVREFDKTWPRTYVVPGGPMHFTIEEYSDNLQKTLAAIRDLKTEVARRDAMLLKAFEQHKEAEAEARKWEKMLDVMVEENVAERTGQNSPEPGETFEECFERRKAQLLAKLSQQVEVAESVVWYGRPDLRP